MVNINHQPEQHMSDTIDSKAIMVILESGLDLGNCYSGSVRPILKVSL